MTEFDNLTPMQRVQRDLLLVESQLDFAEDIDWDRELPANLEELWLERAAAIRLGRALYVMRSRLDTAIAHTLGEGGAARVGDDFIRYSRSPKLEILPELEEWIKENCTATEALMIAPKLSKIRKTGLASVLTRHGFQTKTADGGDLLDGTFYATRWEDPKLSAMPVSNDKAPQYAAEMKSGEIRRRKDKK